MTDLINSKLKWLLKSNWSNNFCFMWYDNKIKVCSDNMVFKKKKEKKKILRYCNWIWRGDWCCFNEGNNIGFHLLRRNVSTFYVTLRRDYYWLIWTDLRAIFSLSLRSKVFKAYLSHWVSSLMYFTYEGIVWRYAMSYSASKRFSMLCWIFCDLEKCLRWTPWLYTGLVCRISYSLSISWRFWKFFFNATFSESS